MNANQQLFTGKADHYTSARPSYSPDLIRLLYTSGCFCRQSVVADIGAGTGKFSRILLERGSFVYAVEPNGDMRRNAKKELASFDNKHIVNGFGEATTLHVPVDFVTCAQAFHWLDPKAFRA